MSDDVPASFPDLIRRLRQGDEAAAAELVRTYGPLVQRVVRMRLTDPRLRRVLDSQDVCQSVLANFCLRAAAGQFDLDSPEQLLKLLATMARNRLVNHLHAQQAGRRDQRRQEADGNPLVDEVAAGPSPSQVVVGRDSPAPGDGRVATPGNGRVVPASQY
jgi:RNA polymerase sigma-70 factor (ECF subfamily)